VAFCGVSMSSPPKCLSKENSFEGEHNGVNQWCLVLQDLQNLQQLLKTDPPEGVFVG